MFWTSARFTTFSPLMLFLTVGGAFGQNASPSGSAAGSASNPIVVTSSGGVTADITAQVLANDYITLNGGSYSITIPATGVAASTLAANDVYSLTNYGAGHYVGANTPSILYTAAITGTGTVTVTNATSTVNPVSTPKARVAFSGGLLLITNPQLFSSGTSQPSLIIDQNTVVAFDKGTGTDVGGSFDPTTSAPKNIVNNGYLYSYNSTPNKIQNSWGSIVSTIAGAGVSTFENGNVLTNGSTYSGLVFNLDGTHIQDKAVTTDTATIYAQDNISAFETQGPNYLVGPTAPTYSSLFSGSYYSFGADSQIQGNGIQIFNGMSLNVRGDSKKDFYPVDEQRYLAGFTNWGGFGNTWYVQATMQMGNGEAIVDTSVVNNGNTYYSNNTFMQTPIQGTGGGIGTGNFPRKPTSLANVYTMHAVAFDYSGTYTYDAGINVTYGGGTYLMNPHIGGSHTYELNGNLIVMNPGDGKAANHLILTSPAVLLGITQIDTNAILQLGDGTTGNSGTRTFIRSNGDTITGTYSTSYGNGMVLTASNAGTVFDNNNGTIAYNQIIDNGALIVDNTPGALDITVANSVLAPIMQANSLDTISGVGSLEQKGTMALTLTGTNTYSGGTTVDANAELIVASATALGARDSSVVSATANVANHGILTATSSNHVINVPGNYSQAP